jgi:hypothetical protein
MRRHGRRGGGWTIAGGARRWTTKVAAWPEPVSCEKAKRDR